MGRKETREGIPCGTCPAYLRMKENQTWLTPDEVKESFFRRQVSVMLRKSGLSNESINQLSQFWGTMKHRLSRSPLPIARGRLINRIDRVSLPLQPDEEKGWRPHPIFRGATRGLSDLSCHVSVLNQNRCPHLRVKILGCRRIDDAGNPAENSARIAGSFGSSKICPGNLLGMCQHFVRLNF